MPNSLRESFLNLASALGHCQENSRSIVDALKRGCSDLAENAEGGGGGSSQEYSTTERKIGKWIDGKDLFEKTVNFGAMAINTTKSVPHGVVNPDTIFIYGGYCTTGTISYMLSHAVSDNSSTWDFSVDATNINNQTFTDRSAINAVVTIRYTKA